MASIAALLKERYPSYPIPTRTLPDFVMQMMVPFDPKIDQWLVDSLYRLPGGFDGTKIVKELGFEYRFTPREALFASAASMVELGIADGTSKPRKAVTILIAIAALVVVGLFFFAKRFCSSSGAKRSDKKKKM